MTAGKPMKKTNKQNNLSLHQKHVFYIKYARHFIFGVKDTWVKEKESN